MSDSQPKSSQRAIFERIEVALSASAHGRAFLHECRRRARSEETAHLLEAVARLEGRSAGPGALDRDELLSLIGQVETSLGEARLALSASVSGPGDESPMRGPRGVTASGRRVAQSIHETAERLQDIAWRLREHGLDAEMCDRLDDETGAIDVAARRQERVADGLAAVERAIGRADAFVTELRRSVAPQGPSPYPLVGGAPLTLLDSDLEFVPAPELHDPSRTR